MSAPDCIMKDHGIGKPLLITAKSYPAPFLDWAKSQHYYEVKETGEGWVVDRKCLIFLINNLPEWFDHPVWRNDRDDCVLKKAGYVAD